MQTRLTFFDIVLFAGMMVGFVIGIHQSMVYSVAHAYWLFMLSTLCFLWLNQRLKKKKDLDKLPEKGATIKDKTIRKSGKKS